MGQDISKAFTPPPLSFRDCLVDGQINLARYIVYRRRQYQDEDYEDDIHQIRMNKRKRDQPKPYRKKKKRAVKKHDIQVRDKDGSIRSATFRDSTWHNLYVAVPPSCNRRKKVFRKRFRLPYEVFLEMTEDIKQHDFFKRWTNNDCIGNEPSDIRLLLLGTLRYLGRALTFDDLEEYTFISAEVHRNFFTAFLEYGSTLLYEKYIVNPASKLDVSAFEKVFAIAGFNGCIGSSDATHVGMLQCPSWALINHKGHKLAIPSRNYNATVTHSRQVLGTTCGHPGTWNDKTLVLFDNLIRGVHEGDLYSDNEFTLLELNENNEEVEVTYKGAWFIVDNGYLNWSCTVPPMKHPITYEEIRFSEWLESMRKDVECTFGIIKKRFTVLKTGIRLGSISQCDKVWRTCCALHNLLLFHDGLDKDWEAGIKMNSSSRKVNEKLPFALDRLTRNKENVTNNHTTYQKDYFKKYSLGGKRVVSKIPLDIFQERLVHHFDLRFKKNDIKWPQRKKRKIKTDE